MQLQLIEGAAPVQDPQVVRAELCNLEEALLAVTRVGARIR